jgi:hypothetical protein
MGQAARQSHEHGELQMIQVQEQPIDTETEVVCSDFDDECKDVKNKTTCWLYQPECGLCPFLKGKQ